MRFKSLVLSFFFFLLSYSVFRVTQNETQPQSYSQSSHSMNSHDYCLAIRGNGELQPAHWGAMAKTVEQLGLPQAMAGGSSASISMLWLNAIAQNPILQDPNLTDEDRNIKAALMIKSLMGTLDELKNSSFSQDIMKLYKLYKQADAEGLSKNLKLQILKKNYAAALRIIKQGIKLGLFDEQALQPLIDALAGHNDQRSLFFANELYDSIRLFGKFDAVQDSNLFFRSGIISFENAAVGFSRIAAFYSGASKNSKVTAAWTEFINQCSPESKNKSWRQIINENPKCADSFHQAFKTYFKYEPQAHYEDKFIGSPISVFVSTSVIMKESVQEVDEAFKQYNQKLDPQFGIHFKISDPENIRFGYWGNPNELNNIQQKLNPQDEKSRRFVSLGNATWKQVLSMSPAEPGLSSLKSFITQDGQRFYSAGGWSDLHPVAVLKASGCENVVYLTRQGGESLFAQGIANRLMQLNRDTNKLITTDPKLKEANSKLNDEGDPSADSNSTWSRLYNLANPKSSVNVSLGQASAILCTNWNNFDATENLEGLVEDSYRSSYWLLNASLNLSPVLQQKRPGCHPY